jgi:hypothetical protein
MSNHLTKLTSDSLKQASPEVLRSVSDGCFLAGFASIAASIAIWAVNKSEAETAHAERFGIFVGLWAPTFFVLSNRLERYADRAEQAQVK